MRKQFIISLILVFVFGLVPVDFSNAITQNQIDAEVQIVCTDGNDSWFSGSGTIIDPKGIILTNRHVIEGAYKNTCFIGFIESINQEPNFGTSGNYNLAEVKYQTASNNMDAAILYLDNPTNKIYPYIDIWDSNSDTLQFGDKIEVIGFPSIGGSTITYTSGDFSGFGSSADGTQNYIKSTALLEHGNSGGASYNLAGQFIGIPTMVVVGSLNSMSYILSVNSIKNWLSGILGSRYQEEVIKQVPTPAKPTVNIQNDITPPYLERFSVWVYAYDDNDELIYTVARDDNEKSAVYEFPKIRFGWWENCKADKYCIKDNSGLVEGYYYYVGMNPSAIPTEDGKYISADDLIDHGESVSIKIPEIFELEAGKSNYFILQAQDKVGNISNPLINFEYIYEPDKFKDITSITVIDKNNTTIGQIKYLRPESPDSGWLDYKNKSIYTNQSELNLCPNYGYKIDGLTYYTLNDPQWFFADLRAGKATSDNCIKIENIDKSPEINIYIKPFSYSVNQFNWANLILRIFYDPSTLNKITIKSDDTLKDIIEFREVDNSLASRLKGNILLQVESNGEAYYIYPNDSKKYYLGRPADAFNVMRKLGLGATHQFINSYTIYPDHVLGKILIDVEQNGEAYYIYPKDKKAYYLGRPTDAFQIMRNLGLGITNDNLNKIPNGSL